MRILALILSLAVIVVVFVDAFETILQPRRVTHRFRLARLFYRSTWTLWRRAGLILKPGKRREALLGVFGPLSLLGLFATWVAGLIFGFALLYWALRTPVFTQTPMPGPWQYVY